MESAGGIPRRRVVSGEKVDSPNLRDFLRIKEDDDRRSLSCLTLSDVLRLDKISSPAQVNRTLLDIIRDEPCGATESKKSWKVFRDKLRFRRACAAWISANSMPASENPMTARRSPTPFPTTVVNSENPTSESIHPELTLPSMSINEGVNRGDLDIRGTMLGSNLTRAPSISTSRHGGGIEGSTSVNTSENNAGEVADLHRQLPSEEREEEETEEDGAGETGEQPARMSLMTLLAEAEREMGLDGSPIMIDDEENEAKEEEEKKRGGEHRCCVCMVRHKGAAFIPCGHTFCRLCCRELWVQRGNCPLCNGLILEILDIF